MSRQCDDLWEAYQRAFSECCPYLLIDHKMPHLMASLFAWLSVFINTRFNLLVSLFPKIYVYRKWALTPYQVVANSMFSVTWCFILTTLLSAMLVYKLSNPHQNACQVSTTSKLRFVWSYFHNYGFPVHWPCLVIICACIGSSIMCFEWTAISFTFVLKSFISTWQFWRRGWDLKGFLLQGKVKDITP